MAARLFHIVQEVCHTGLVHTSSRDFRGKVARLRNALLRESRDETVSELRARAMEQAASLTELLERYKPVEPDYPGDGVRPTPQTVARLKPDTILEMLRRGSLCREHQMAAEEIRNIFQALVSGLMSKSAALDQPRIDLRTTGPYRQPVERMPERLVRLYHDRYKPWADETETLHCGGRSLLDFTIEVIVDGRTLHEVERKQSMRNGSASICLRKSLQRYAEIAGWLEVEPDGVVSAVKKKSAPRSNRVGSREDGSLR